MSARKTICSPEEPAFFHSLGWRSLSAPWPSKSHNKVISIVKTTIIMGGSIQIFILLFTVIVWMSGCAWGVGWV